MTTRLQPAADPDSPSAVVMVKLGGSLLTDKTGIAEARTAVIVRLAGEIAAALPALKERREALVLGHGSGSYGHVAAHRHGLGEGLGTRPVLGAADTQNQAARLHRQVATALIEAGVPAWSWAPSTALAARRGKLVSGSLDGLLGALQLGLVPLVYGDVVLDHALGACIASTEAVLGFLVPRLSKRGLAVRRIFWMGETDGIYDRQGKTIPRVDASNRRAVRSAIGGTAGTDVTGGMLLRLRATELLARRGITSWIVDGRRPGLLTSALIGDDIPGTLVPANPSAAGASSS